MKVTHGQIIARGLANRCPNCGGHRLFKEGKLFELNDGCPDCGLKFEKDEGFFLGAMSLNYGVTLVGFLVPVLVLWYIGWVGGRVAIGLAMGGALLIFLPWMLSLFKGFFTELLEMIPTLLR